MSKQTIQEEIEAAFNDFEKVASAAGKRISNAFKAGMDELFKEHDPKKTEDKERECIVELPDENAVMHKLYAGDQYWYVSEGWTQITEWTLRDVENSYTKLYPKSCFATNKAAEKYVYENQPVYSRYTVYLAEQAINVLASGSQNIEALDAIRAFRAQEQAERLKKAY